MATRVGNSGPDPGMTPPPICHGSYPPTDKPPNRDPPSNPLLNPPNNLHLYPPIYLFRRNTSKRGDRSDHPCLMRPAPFWLRIRLASLARRLSVCSFCGAGYRPWSGAWRRLRVHFFERDAFHFPRATRAQIISRASVHSCWCEAKKMIAKLRWETVPYRFTLRLQIKAASPC